jgi:pimeloyl-ACP methyl ester carboxylesterase
MHKAICLNGVTPAKVAFAPLAAALEGQAELILKDLDGYAADFADDYGPKTELEAIRRLAEAAGWDRFHLLGQSFGASVALAFAREHPQRVISLALVEPPFVGNDCSWSETYAGLLAALDQALQTPLVERPLAFFRALTAPGQALPLSATGAPPEWLLPRSERQGRMWPRWRDGTRGPLQLLPPVRDVYVALGGRTHPGFRAVAEWLGARVPSAVIDVYPERSHFDAPHVAEAPRFAQALLSMWDSHAVST